MVRHFRSQFGFTLVEIMVAMVIGLVITAGAGYLFISNKQTYEMAEAVARIQEAGRFALNKIAEDLRMAGHLGCADPSQINVVANDPRLNVDDAFTAPVDFDPDTELLRIRYASSSSVELASDMASRTADVVLTNDSGLRAGSNAFIANCTRADVFAVSDDTIDSGTGAQTLGHAISDDEGSSVNTSNELSEAYEIGASTSPRVRTFRVREYEVNPDADTNGAGDSVGALLRNDETLVHGIERMALRFGECMGTNQIRYVDWASVDDPEKIVAVRVGFLLHSRERVLEEPDAGTYFVAGVQVDAPGAGNDNTTHAGDRRLRQAFTTTVSLRNERVDEC